MTNPRIEELVEEFRKTFNYAHFTWNGSDATGELFAKRSRLKIIKWLRQALTQAQQAGKIQALHLLEDLYAKAEDKAELIEMFNEALQDNK